MSLARRRAVALLAAVVAAGAALRFAGLGHSLRVDEAETWARSKVVSSDILAREARLPHVYFLSHASQQLIGDSEAALRLPFTLYGILSLLGVFALGAILFDLPTGLIACALAAASPTLIQYAQEARYYSPFLFYSTASLCALAGALKLPPGAGWGSRSAWWGGFTLSVAANLYVHAFALYPTILCLVAALAAAARGGASGRRAASGALAAAGVAALLYCPWWQPLANRLSSDAHGDVSLAQGYLIWHGRLDAVAWVETGKSLLGGWPMLALVTATAAAGAALRRDRTEPTVLLTLWLAAPLASLYVFRAASHFEPRYFIFLIPPALVASAAGMVALTRAAPARLRPWLGVALLAAFLSAGAAPLRAYYRAPKARLREAVAHVAARCAAGDAVVPYPSWDLYWHGYYPLPRGCRLFHSANLLEEQSSGDLLRAHRRVWLIGSWISDPVRRQEFDKMRQRLEFHCKSTERVRFSARESNDDVHVQAFERTALPPVTAAALPRAPRSAGLPMKGNVFEILENHAGLAGKSWSFSGSGHLEDGLDCGKPSLTGARGASLWRLSSNCALYVWSGRGSLESKGRIRPFRAGELYRVSAGSILAVLPSSSASLLLLPLPQGEGPGPGQIEGPILPLTADGPPAWAGSLIRRVPPGGGEALPPAGVEGMRSGIGVVLAGLLEASPDSIPVPLHFRKGDVFYLRWKALLTLRNLDKEPLVALMAETKGPHPEPRPFYAARKRLGQWASPR